MATLLLGVQAGRKIEAYRGAVVGESIHVGSVSGLLGSSRTYAKGDCSAKFLDDDKTTAGATLEIGDAYQGASRAAFLVAHLKTATGDLSYELTCGEESGVGLIHVAAAKSISVSPESNVFLDLNQDEAAKDQYVFIQGIEGNNVNVKVDSKDTSGYFDVTIGGLNNLKFYQKKDDGSLVEVKVTTFDKVLPIREWDTTSQDVQDDSKLVSTLAVLQNDGATLSFYELESSKNLGRVYVHSGNKAIAAGKDYALDHCFPVIYEGTVTNYYCTYQIANPKLKGPIVYFDIASPDEELKRREFTGLKSILQVSSISDGRTCFLGQEEAGDLRVNCFDAKTGFDKTPDNEKTYFSGKTIKININGEDCTLNLKAYNTTDFMFGEASVFDCKSGKVLASFEFDNTTDSDAPQVVKSYKSFDPKLIVPLCANEDEIITLEDSSTTLVFEGGNNRPGQLIRYPLGIESTTVTKVHCSRDSALVLLDSKKKTHLLDINRGSKKDSITRVNTLVDISGKPSALKVATSQTAILYSFGKKGQVTSLLQYNGYFGLVRITNKQISTPGKHSLTLTATDGTNTQKFTVTTNIEVEEKFSVVANQPFKGLIPGKEYPLRDFFNITGQVASIEVQNAETVKNIFWKPDEVVFVNSQNGTAKGSKFALGDYFVNVETKGYVGKDKKEKKLDANTLSEGRFLGLLPLDQPVAIIGKLEESHLSVQALYIGQNGEIQGSQIVKLNDEVDSDFARQPHLVNLDGKQLVVFYKSSENDESKGIAVEYKFDKEQSNFQFLNQDNQKEVEWSTGGSVAGYHVKPVKSDHASKLSSCVQFKLSGGDSPVSNVYYVCGVTGGSTERVEIRNFGRTADGKVEFDLLNYPSESALSHTISWWKITSNLLDQNNKPVSPSAFVPTTTLVKKFDGITGHSIKKLYNLGDYSVVISKFSENDEEGLYETYYGTRGNKPYFSKKINDAKTAAKNYDLGFAVVDGTPKRIYTNYGKDFSNVADLQFKDARVRLSSHLATVQVKQPFALSFNDGFKVSDVAVDLDKFYEDDGKTDEDDEKTEPEDDPSRPGNKKRKSRLWLILGILALIIVVGAADLFLRRRSAIAEAESELDHDKPKVTKKKKSGKNEDGDLSEQLNEL